MSYQFDDESALEELLNQQLDRSRQQAAAVNEARRPVTAKPEFKPSSNVVKSRPLSGSNVVTNNPNILNRNKLAEWLNPSSTQQDDLKDDDNITKIALSSLPSRSAPSNQKQSEPDISGFMPSKDSVVKRKPDETVRVASKISDQSRKNLIDLCGNESELQQMSKQRLVQLILDDLVPAIGDDIKSSKELSDAQTKSKQLDDELNRERQRIESLQREYDERLKIIEASWAQLNKQLGYRVDLYEKELKDTIDRYNCMLTNLDNEHKNQLDHLVKNYESRIELQKSHFDDELKRRQSIHELEMSSRMRVSGDMDKLDGYFNCWHETIETTIKQLETQFKSIEILLDKQTATIRGNSDAILQKNRQTIEQSDRFEAKVVEFGSISQSIRDLVEKMSQKSIGLIDIGDLLRQADDKLCEVIEKSKQLEAKQLEQVAEIRSIEEQKFELRLKSSELERETKRLSELIESNQSKADKMSEHEIRLKELDQELNLRQTELDKRRLEIEHEDENIESQRKQLGVKECELGKWQTEIARERRALKKHSRQLNYDLARLADIKSSAQKELNQLRRLQNSIVCSICLERLCQLKPAQLADLEPSRSKQDIGLVYKMDSNNNNNNSSSDNDNHNNKWPLKARDIERMSRLIESEWKELAKECKYVNLLSSTTTSAANKDPKLLSHHSPTE